MGFLFDVIISRIYKLLLEANEPYEPLDILDKNCLCLTPHADDESVGMGGTILKHASQFDLICLTNGCSGADEEKTPQEKIATRKAEFLKAMEKIGVKSYDFWEYCDDRKLILNSEYFSKINIADYDYIFLPNIIEQHRDHKAVSILLKELLKRKKHKKHLKIIFYEVWQALPLPNRYVDISSIVNKKLDLLNTYKSQLVTNDYLKIIDLNSYRGLLPGIKHAEAFQVMDTKTFKQVCKIYGI